MFENGFRTITDYVIHLWSWNFIHLLPMSQGCALLILGSKGQRSRSWIIDVWKWFPDHNWLCNPYKFGVGSGFLVNFWVALYPCTNESRMFNSCLYKGFLQLGFLHLWCTLYLFNDNSLISLARALCNTYFSFNIHSLYTSCIYIFVASSTGTIREKLRLCYTQSDLKDIAVIWFRRWLRVFLESFGYFTSHCRYCPLKFMAIAVW